MRTSGPVFAALVLAVGFAAVSCDKSPTPTEAPAAEKPADAEPAPDAAAEEPAPEAAPTWAEMDRKQRKRFMGLEVLPKMKGLFQEYDAKTYGSFKCQTCHGDDWTDVDFKMPNSLYPLPADNPIEAAREYDAEITAFMVDKVLPESAKLLGQEFDKTTGKGDFGCHSCHLVE